MVPQEKRDLTATFFRLVMKLKSGANKVFGRPISVAAKANKLPSNVTDNKEREEATKTNIVFVFVVVVVVDSSEYA